MNHLGGGIPNGDGNTWMPDVFGYILVKYGIGTMVDVGCGYGHTLKWFQDYGVTGVGIDGDKEAIDKNVYSGTKVLHDFTKGPYVHGTAFDLAWSSELLEHVEEKFVDNLAPCFQASRLSVVTHAEPHQGGHHHVNCQTDSYWIARFRKWNLVYDVAETMLLRRTDRHHAAWGRRTLMVFKQE